MGQIKQVAMRDFLRGGYKDVREPALVTWHGRPAFVVTPVDWQVEHHFPTGDDTEATGRSMWVTTAPLPARTYVASTQTTPKATRSFAPTNNLPAWLRPQEEKDAQEG
jgi:hypothetical protein